MNRFLAGRRAIHLIGVVALVVGLFFSMGRAQQLYGGLGSGLVADGGPTVGVQAGGAVSEQFGVRALAETNFDLTILSAEGFYTPNSPLSTWQGYYGGGVSATWLSSFPSNARTLVFLPTLTGGVVYRTGEVGFFGEVRLLIYFPFPAPELRAGVNYYF